MLEVPARESARIPSLGSPLYAGSESGGLAESKVTIEADVFVNSPQRHGGSAALHSGGPGWIMVREVPVGRGTDADTYATINDYASEATAEAARRKLEDCDYRLGKYRAALDGGADPKEEPEVFAGLGLSLTYHPDQRRVVAEARPCGGVRQTVSEGGLEPPRPCGH